MTEKLPYNRPALRVHGDLSALTRAGTGSVDEMAMMTNMMMRP